MVGDRYNPFRALLWWVGCALSWAGLVDLRRVRRTTDLAWPRIVTGVSRVSQSAVDLAMVGTALGTAAIAGVGFAAPFWGLAITVGGGLAGGTISQVSRRFGAGAHGELELVCKESALAAVVLSVPFTAAFWLFPDELVGLLGDGAAAAHGATYLRWIGLAVPAGAVNLVASRTLVGADDAWTPMVVRAGGALVNVGLNAVLIFGLDLGILGAALGTVIANLLVTSWFVYGFLGGRLPGIGTFPVTVSIDGPYVDRGLLAELGSVATPLIATGVASAAAQFPLLAIVGLFGPDVVAAFVVGRRVRGLMGTPGWGFGLASSSLVGQQLGAGDEHEAEAYGWDILSFSLAVYATIAVGVLAFARPVAGLFVDGGAVPTVTPFVQVATVSVIGAGIDGSATGPLRASGDTRWPLYGKLVGLYVVTIPLAYLGAVTPVGVAGLYLALVAETVVPALITFHRFRTGNWKVVSRALRPTAAPAAAD